MNSTRILRPLSVYLLHGRALSQQGAVVAPVSTANKPKMKMAGWQIHSYGGTDELIYCDKIKIPQIRSASECLVRVKTTAVNPIDVLMLNGYGAQFLKMLRCQPNVIEFPLTLGREFCGELVQRGMGVDNSKVSLGDRVWGVVPVHSNGSHAEYVVVPEYCLSRAPSELSDEEAAATLYAGLTAWSGLYVTGGLGGTCGALTSSGGGADKRILVLGGSGSVGSLAIQMLKAHGCQVLATCNEDAVELVTGIGADCVVDYKNPAQMETLRSYGPYDIILDCAGQGAEYADKLNLDFRQYITFSSPLLRNIDSSGIALGLLKNVSNLIETNVKTLSQQRGLVKWGFFAPAPQGIEMLKKLVERKKVLPIIDSSFSGANMKDAFDKVQSGHLRGKVVVKL